jgi:predicted ATPase
VALAIYPGVPLSPFLARELERIKKEGVYQNRFFFIRNLGFITPTEVRRIGFEDTVRFRENSRRDLPNLWLRTGLSRARKSGGTGQRNQSSN